jgi:hypothetical protein
MTSHNIIKSFKRKGSTVLGVGCYSAAVASKDPDYIIKVGSSTSDPWLDYYSMVIEELPSNDHVPYVKKLYQDNEHDFYIAIVERLEPLDVHKEDRELVRLLREYCQNYYTDKDIIEELANFESRVPCPHKLLKLLKLIKQRTTHYSVNYSNRDEYESEADTRTLDMHTGNFMLRNGVIVVIDPWCDLDMTEVPSLSDWADDNL